MHTVKKFFKKYFSSFLFFYGYLRHRIFIAIVLSILVGVLDGFGLAMFLPLLQMADGNESIDADGLGKLSFLLDGFHFFGLELNLNTILLLLCLFFIFKGIFKYFGGAYSIVVRQFFIRTLRIQMLDDLNGITYKAFVTSDSGRIQNTMTGEADKVMSAYNTYFRSLEQLIMVAVYMSFAFFVDVRFAVLVTIGGILTNLVYNGIYKLTKKASAQVTKQSNVFQGLILQHVSNFKYLKGTGLLHKFGNKLKSTILKLENNNKKIGIYNAIVGAAREPLLIIVVSAVILIQTKVLGSPLGPILISLLFFYRALTALMNMQTSYNNFLGVSGSMGNMTEFLTGLYTMREKKGDIIYQKFNKNLVFKEVGVFFGNKKILEGISLTIMKNETVAFVGESGSGKSTIVNVVAGLFPPDQGMFLIDEMDSQKLKIDMYQKRLGYITQDAVIFSDTIFNNVTFWDEPNEKNLKRFSNALEEACILSFVQKLEKKENTILGNNGINLSGGQKQRISIARELYKDIDILIMDEATSALDSETEKLIQQSINALKGKYTILMIAHRLTTVKSADSIVLMNDGKVEQIGSFENLVKSNTRFEQMIKLQEFND